MTGMSKTITLHNWNEIPIIGLGTWQYDGNDNNIFPLTEDGRWKIAGKCDPLGTWKAMEELVVFGLTKSVGVSNFSISQIERICKMAKHKPVTNQVECLIYCPQKELFDGCKKLEVTLTAYSPIGSPGRPENLKEADEPVALEDPFIQRIAKKYGKTPAQILLRNLIQRGIIVTPKSVTPERIRGNFQVFDFSLSKGEMGYIDQITIQRRYFDMSAMFKDHPERP